MMTQTMFAQLIRDNQIVVYRGFVSDDGVIVKQRDTWDIPADFSEEEVLLLAEICVNGVINVDDAHKCVRLLRK